MKNQIIFKKGQKVVITYGNNASDFNRTKKWSLLGPYCLPYWEDTVFTIEGTVKLITLKFSPRVYGAYLLKYRGVRVGYVYNTGILPAPQVSYQIKN